MADETFDLVGCLARVRQRDQVAARQLVEHLYPLVSRIVRSHPSLPAIMLTGENAIDNVVQAMKTGATNYISKSSSGAELIAAVEQALRESAGRTPPVDTRLEGLGIVAHSPALRAKLEEAARCARSTISVLVTGETGVGKDLVARAIHALSPRREKPFIPLDVPNIDQQAAQMDEFARCVLDNRETAVPGEMGRKDIAVMEAIYASAASGKRVVLSE